GKGKSTLLRIIDKSEPYTGDVEYGYNLEKTFYAQHQLESLNVQNEILDELSSMGSGKLENELRTILGCFLFTGDDVFKKIKVLSGGEKARVALAKALVHEANFLLLDEPTNHLDIQSMNILIQALQEFEGSFITVSHDRHFISKIANKIWWIEDAQIKEYLGTYEEWKYFMANRKIETKEKEEPKTIKNKSNPVPEKSEEDVIKKKLQKQLNLLEEDLNLLKKEKEKLELSRAKQPDTDSIGTISEQYKVLETSILEKNKEFEAIFEQLISL